MVRSKPGSPTEKMESEYLVNEIPSSASKDHLNPLDRVISRSRSRISASLSDPEQRKTVYLVLAALLVIIIGSNHLDSGASSDPMMALKKADPRTLSVATWNIAAINNNPFEYWITYDENPEYNKIMKNIEEFIENPGAKDVPVKDVFTEAMFRDLETRMAGAGWDPVRSYWESDYQNRKIVSGFMKDPELGSKRLASMPDRITNTINVEGSDEPVCRPTVINMYGGDLSTSTKWWKSWVGFMFDEPLTIKTTDGLITKRPYEMLQPIKKSKYPAITESEEALSLPLQTMCGAIFDAILVHMMNTVSSPKVWQPLKKTMVEALNKKKVPHTLDILVNTYGNSDIITLQEVSSSFIDQAKAGPLGQKYWIASPKALDAVRDQNSVIMLKKEAFPSGEITEITEKVEANFPEGVKVPVAAGDINAITAVDNKGIPFVIASFHGDTNGLATVPVNAAIMKTLKTTPELFGHRLIFGLDANTYEHATPGKQQDVMTWGLEYSSLGLSSCWGDVPQKSNYTTFNARTYLQPQLNKACKSSQKRERGDVNPKDFVIFKNSEFEVVRTWKDNTGNRDFIEDMAFPTLNFPSDHAVLATVLKRKF